MSIIILLILSLIGITIFILVLYLILKWRKSTVGQIPDDQDKHNILQE